MVGDTLFLLLSSAQLPLLPDSLGLSKAKQIRDLVLSCSWFQQCALESDGVLRRLQVCSIWRRLYYSSLELYLRKFKKWKNDLYMRGAKMLVGILAPILLGWWGNVKAYF